MFEKKLTQEQSGALMKFIGKEEEFNKIIFENSPDNGWSKRLRKAEYNIVKNVDGFKLIVMLETEYFHVKHLDTSSPGPIIKNKGHKYAFEKEFKWM